MIMKEQMKTQKANNLQCGRIYINATTGQPCRLVYIVPCQGAWLESYDGQGYGITVSFEDVHYASQDEVEDYLEDLRAFTADAKAPSHKIDMTKFSHEYAYGKTIVRDADGSAGIGWYDDNDGNDIRCKD